MVKVQQDLKLEILKFDNFVKHEMLNLLKILFLFLLVDNLSLFNDRI